MTRRQALHVYYGQAPKIIVDCDLFRGKLSDEMTVRNLFKNAAEETHLDEDNEAYAYMNWAVKRGADKDNEAILCVITLISFFDLFYEFDEDDETPIKFKLNDEILIDSTIGKLKTEYKDYMMWFK